MVYGQTMNRNLELASSWVYFATAGLWEPMLFIIGTVFW